MIFHRMGLSFLCVVWFAVVSRSQTNTYILNGSATQDNCNCYTLTSAANDQSGSVWNGSQISLQQPFNFSFNVFLGCKDSVGADGIVFILQTVPTSVGAVGGGIGFDGVSPSVGIALDTWQNIETNDPPYDHISIQANGITNHGADLAGPVPASADIANIEDCKWHVFRISWDPVTKMLRSWFDDNLRVEAQVDLAGTIFTNHPGVYWGFSAATGGANNLQQFCTALNPGFTTNFVNNAACVGNGPVQFTNTSVSFAPIARFHWDFGDGTSSALANPPPHLYTVPGLYKVKLAITGFDGCNSDTLEKIIAIGDYPVAAFDVYDTCAGTKPRITDRSSLSVGHISQWKWQLGGNSVATPVQAQLDNLAPGDYTMQLIVESNYGCSSAPVQKRFTVKPVPFIDAQSRGMCINEPVLFKGEQTDNATNISNWSWNFGDGRSSSAREIAHVYSSTGKYTVQLDAKADNGCTARTDTVLLHISEAVANAGNDTVILKAKPFRLHGTGGTSYSWSPAQAMSDPGIPNPVVDPGDDITYKLIVTTAEGCTDDDEVAITVFKGSDIFVPTAFSPNNDGINERFKPYYAGIKTLGHFTVYNRWGQVAFSSNNIDAGWDGMINGIKQAAGVYVWRLKAVDYAGKIYEIAGTVTLIR